jgi:hypothetical protein
VFNYPILPTLLTVSATFIWLASLSIIVWKYTNRLSLTRDSSNEVLQGQVKNLAQEIEQIKSAIKDNRKVIEWLKSESAHYVQKIGLVRFNPFKDTGGDQSFSLAALDSQDNGFVFSSLHSRSGHRIYAKAIREGRPKKHELSDEESQAIKLAMSPKSKK